MKILFSLFLILVLSQSTKATILVVDNNPNNSTAYAILQDAIDAASDNDTIYIQPSGTSYTSATIEKPLVLIGIGRHPNKVNQSLSKMTILYIGQGSEGSTIQGIDFSNGIFHSGSPDINNITIRHCRITNTIIIKGDNYTIENCILGRQNNNQSAIVIGANAVSNNNILVQNNIILSSINNMAGSGNTLRNNLFLPNTTAANTVFRSSLPGEFVIVENNIFYGQSAENCSSCTFNNNITYLTLQDTLPFGNNTGADNLIWINIGFVDAPLPSFSFLDDFYSSHDVHLDTGTPGVNVGTDGNDIGLYGGSDPFTKSGESDIPMVREFNLENSTIPENGIMHISILLTAPE